MNLFIGNHFVNTFGNKVDILQLIRLVTEDNETVQAECVEILEREYNLDEVDLANHATQGLIEDEVLYVNGEAALVIINQLFDHDYDEVMDRIAQQIDAYESGVLRLTANGFPEVIEAAPTPLEGFTEPTAPAIPAAELFNEDPEWLNTPTEVVLGVVSEGPALTVDGKNIAILKSADGEVLYSVTDLYRAAYGMQHESDYIKHLIVRNRVVLDVMQSEIRKECGEYFFSTNVLAILHGDLASIIEFQSLVQDVTMTYEETIAASPDVTSVNIDQFGNLL